MSSRRLKDAALSSRRLVLLTVTGVVATALLFGGFFCLNGQIPQSIYWKTGVIFLIGAEIMYVSTALITLLGAVVIGLLLFAQRTSRTGRLKLARVSCAASHSQSDCFWPR